MDLVKAICAVSRWLSVAIGPIYTSEAQEKPGNSDAVTTSSAADGVSVEFPELNCGGTQISGRNLTLQKAVRDFDFRLTLVIFVDMTPVVPPEHEMNIPAEEAADGYDRIVNAATGFGIRLTGLNVLVNMCMTSAP